MQTAVNVIGFHQTEIPHAVGCLDLQAGEAYRPGHRVARPGRINGRQMHLVDHIIVPVDAHGERRFRAYPFEYHIALDCTAVRPLGHNLPLQRIAGQFAVFGVQRSADQSDVLPDLI